MPSRRQPCGRKRSPPSNGATAIQSSKRSGRHGAESEFRQSQARLIAVLETAVDAIITIDHRGHIQSVNPATTRMFGYKPTELIGRNVDMLMPSPYREEHDQYIKRYLQTGERKIIGIGREVQAQRKDGTVFPVDLAVSEVEPGKLFTGIIRDISDRRLAEARLRESDRMASIGALAAGLGHDMNNVLLPVRAHLNALKSGDRSAPESLEHIERIQRGVAYLQQLADGLHYLAMDPDRVDDTEGSTDLRRWWSQTGPLLSKAVPKHVKVTASLPEDLPQVAMPTHALTQAVLNLIVNAGEAIPGPPHRTRRQGYVRLSAKVDELHTSIHLGVTDNGAGMTEDVKRRAFDMFFTTKPRGLGTGLGLALVRRVVDRAGGEIHINTSPGRGTTIELTIPAVPRRDSSSADGPKVVIALEDHRAASLIRSLLEAAGARIESSGGHGGACADILVVDGTPAGLADAVVWRKSIPKGRLVVIGPPPSESRARWKSLHGLIVEDAADLESIRIVIGQAMSRPMNGA